MALRADDVDLGRDRDLVQRFQNGDPQAFDDLYRRYFERLNRFCRRHTRDHHEAEEVAQEAFVKALRSMDSLTGEQRFYPWMTVIAKRITIDRHRKASRMELTDEPDLGSVEPDIDHLFAAVDVDHVRTAMANLGPRHRDVLRLRETEGMSYADIATHMDVPMTTVEALLHRARKALRREYTKLTGESGALGVFGLLGTRIATWRDRLGDRWAELAAIAAPAAVAAITAAVVLVPHSPDATPTAAPPAAVVDTVATTTSAPSMPPVPSPVDLDAPTAPTPTAPTPPPTTAAPTAAVGPVDVFTGPDGYDRALDETERQPVRGKVGPADAGIDPPVTVGDVADFLDDLATFLGDDAGPTGDDTPAPDDEPPIVIFGGS